MNAATSLERGRQLKSELDQVNPLLESTRQRMVDLTPLITAARETWLESRMNRNFKAMANLDRERSILANEYQGLRLQKIRLEAAVRIHSTGQRILVMNGILHDPEYEAYLQALSEWKINTEWLIRAREEDNPEARHYADPGPPPIEPPLKLLTAPETMNNIHKRYIAAYPRAGSRRGGSRKSKNGKSRKSRK